MRLALACVVCLSLTACTEDEADCFARISTDLDKAAQAANANGFGDMALVARQSAVTASTIYADTDRNICDYVTAGVRLERG